MTWKDLRSNPKWPHPLSLLLQTRVKARPTSHSRYCVRPRQALQAHFHRRFGYGWALPCCSIVLEYEAKWATWSVAHFVVYINTSLPHSRSVWPSLDRSPTRPTPALSTHIVNMSDNHPRDIVQRYIRANLPMFRRHITGCAGPHSHLAQPSWGKKRPENAAVIYDIVSSALSLFHTSITLSPKCPNKLKCRPPVPAKLQLSPLQRLDCLTELLLYGELTEALRIGYRGAVIWLAGDLDVPIPARLTSTRTPVTPRRGHTQLERPSTNVRLGRRPRERCELTVRMFWEVS